MMETLACLYSNIVAALTRSLVLKETELSPEDEYYLVQIQWLGDDASYAKLDLETELEFD
ncbi:hypothetical protein IQ235_04760 [Oscillatoriales cyanobacterium LEGE 11467]|uniref:Uncharacterized protein n=1 Tax=Zarconia navalis LEGE 11467 TaxID=1828826 RepID=A0A928Z7W1_9CYAN|nr:hypothetical protein [Zarconia navalis]MBE9040103.1 hypothetical protein [Zarconia navalis LEGE 11467]